MILFDTDIDKKFNRACCQKESGPLLVHCLPKILWHALADSETEVTPTQNRCSRCILRAKLFFHLTAFLENTIQSGLIGFTVLRRLALIWFVG